MQKLSTRQDAVFFLCVFFFFFFFFFFFSVMLVRSQYIGHCDYISSLMYPYTTFGTTRQKIYSGHEVCTGKALYEM